MTWHILVVDDEPLNREIIGEYLDDPAYVLTMAKDGQDAWEQLSLAGTRCDLIVLDRMMPRMGGMELLQRVKADARFSHVPVLMQTAASSSEQVSEGIAAGAYYYLTKPYNPGALLAVVHAALDDVRDQRAAADAGKAGTGFSLAVGDERVIVFHTLDEAHHLAGELANLGADVSALAMGLTELLVNAIEHGNLGITYAEKKHLRQNDGWEDEVNRRLASADLGARRARITIARQPESFTFTIEDEGAGFDWQRYLEFDPERVYDPNGRGIAMAKRVAFGTLEYHGRGNVVVATVSASPTA
ncbi:MAG: response regulator [Rhodocyclaceae bacterium]|nr:response regulator [Rhodocyclaceae bacterium]